MHKARLLLRPLRRGRSAELSRYESADPSTELLRFPGIFCLGQDSHERLRARRTDNNPARAVELGVDLFDFLEQVVGEVLCGDSHILLGLWKTRQHRGRLGEAVARYVILQVDDVTRLLAPEQAALTAERLHHVAVTDVGREQANPPLLGKAVEAV